MIDPQVNPTVIAEPVKWFGETIGFWIQTLMLAISAIAAIWIIKSRGNQEARRATIDLLFELEQGEASGSSPTVKDLLDRGQINLARYVHEPAAEEYKAIIFALNSHEFIASGIKTHALSEEVYKRMRYSAVIRDREALEGFIADFRTLKRTKTLFQDFEWLYDRWKKDPLKQNR